MARGHYEPYGASANRDPEFMQPRKNSSSLASIAADRGRRSVAVPRRERAMIKQERVFAKWQRGETGRESYGNDVMKVYEGGTVAASPAAAEGGEGCKKRREQKFSYIRHR